MSTLIVTTSIALSLVKQEVGILMDLSVGVAVREATYSLPAAYAWITSDVGPINAKTSPVGSSQPTLRSIMNSKQLVKART
jgi:hypothetical protein